jgi:hypothetical protein
MSEEIKPFEIDIPEAEVERYYRKIKDTRVPTKDIVPNAGSDYGFTTEWPQTFIGNGPTTTTGTQSKN